MNDRRSFLATVVLGIAAWFGYRPKPKWEIKLGTWYWLQGHTTWDGATEWWVMEGSKPARLWRREYPSETAYLTRIDP